MRKKFVLLVFCLCIGMVYAQQNAKKIALLIGNSDYEKWGGLNKVKDDVTIMKEALEKIGFCIFENKVHENLSTKEMKDLLVRFEKAIRESRIVCFYYSGHGMEPERAYLMVRGGEGLE